jgi:transcriptional regulator with XRE-family HTH domain
MQRTFLREWRNHRDLSLESVAAQIGMTHGNLSRIERGRQPYDEELLDGLAKVYECSPVDLLSRHPSDPEGLYAIWDGLRETQRRQFLIIGQTLRDAS